MGEKILTTSVLCAGFPDRAMQSCQDEMNGVCFGPKVLITLGELLQLI
ncbi:MAG: hypothetical protein DDT37_01954 [Firmicutes bacterium]|nr:hypothetical protein [candidate division NPL-UPA2 bacterium]